MSLLLQLALQWRERLLDLGERRLLRNHIGLGDLAKSALSPHQIEDIAHDLDDLLGRRDLAAQRRFLHNGEHDVGRERDMRCLQLIALILRRCLERFDVSKVGAKHVGRVGHAHLPGKDIEYARIWYLARNVSRNFLTERREAGIDAGKKEAELSTGVLPRN